MPNWLTDNGSSLDGLTQAHLDLWQAEGPTTRRIAEHFLKWAIKAKAAPAGLTIISHPRGTSAKLDKTGQAEALNRVLNAGGQIEARDQAAAILVFGQQAERIAQLAWEDVTVTEELVTVQLGSINIAAKPVG
ncbi:hypothetical protein [Arthrobacter sp. efr-133-TYG-104]|uniref:hypothetical protein n=1 Tax=Arthrobacter sp. efr-133-TYG-104 TaxID=3040324 RepID=UPI00254D2ECE|nr:hypothetical protein [Arthrobacter sp. efr-133-TYG-104]